MTAVYARAPGLRVEPIGQGWAAFSPRSGETVLLNDEAAALLEVLADKPASLDTLCATVAHDTALTAPEIRSRVDESWQQFVHAGLVLLT
ncbi:MAG: HPr-rel-A system PqqD family peptide chaperone [Aquincola sp.]|nr:HPr-rel-A system PqqD family peptide chaperone [Aquincola sp.]